MFKFIHIADVHLGMHPDKDKVWSDDRAAEIEATFDTVLEHCATHEVNLLLIAGDLFDAPPTETELRKLDARLKKATGTKVVIVTGSSDAAPADSIFFKYGFESDVTVLPPDVISQAYFEELGVAVTGISYGKEHYDEPMLEHITPAKEGAFNILLGYGGEKGYMPFSKDRLLEKGFDYIALGRRHKPTVIAEHKMAFAGSLEPLSYKETGEHGYFFGKSDPEEGTEVSFVPVSLRRYVNLTVEVLPDMNNAAITAKVEEAIRESGSQNIFRILVKGYKNSDVTINLSEILRRYQVLEFRDKTGYSYDIEELARENTGNLLGEIVTRLSDEESLTREDIREKAKRYAVLALMDTGVS